MDLMRALVIPGGAIGSLLAEGWRAYRGETPYSEVPPLAASPWVVGAAVLDRTFTLAMNLLAGVPGANTVRRVRRELELASEFFEEQGWLADPRGYYETPASPRVYERVPARARQAARMVDFEHVSWPSGFKPQPHHPGRERWLEYDENATAHAYVLEHPGAPRPWLVCVHGFSMGSPMVNFYGFDALWLHRELGLNVAMPVLPLHGPRAVTRMSGGELLAADYMNLVLTFAQGVYDVRSLLYWLRDHGAQRVGLYGQSLGAYTSALVSCVESELACVIGGIPVADFPRVVRDNMPRLMREYDQEFELDWDLLRRATHPVSPLAMPSLVDWDKRFIALWRHWDRCRIHWFSGSHVGAMWVRSLQGFIAEALDLTGFR
jgi:hypothetical protein